MNPLDTLELSTAQKSFLRLLEERPTFKFTGLPSREMNIMGAIGIVKYGGNFQWEFTPLGRDILKDIQLSRHVRVQEKSEVSG